jgi:DNA topoisomerase-6 subunit B
MSIAQEMADKHKQIAISEFFEKNKHFLGFDTLPRSIITAVKEGVDNSLDAAEEARILPELKINISKVKGEKNVLELCVEDNGPGIPRSSLEKVFGRLLFGSRFHSIRQTRGQQGIGITGVVMYGQLTTGKPTNVISKITSEATAATLSIGIDTRRNRATKSNEDRIASVWSDGRDKEHGLSVTTQMKAKYQRGKQSVYQYLRMTSIVNPHADITLTDPDGEIFHFPRVTEKLPKIVDAIKPHPQGIHLGQLQRMLRETAEPTLQKFLQNEFSGVSKTGSVPEICELSGLDKNRKPNLIKPNDIKALLEAFNGERGYLRRYMVVDGRHKFLEKRGRACKPGERIAKQLERDLISAMNGKRLSDTVPIIKKMTDWYCDESLEDLLAWMQKKIGVGPYEESDAKNWAKYVRHEWDPRVDLMAARLYPPPVNCLSPIEELLIKKGLSKTIDSRFVTTLTRQPMVSQGNPFQVEVGLIFGGGMQADSPVEVLRFANRVPLMYQQGGCLLTRAIESVDWRQYGLEQSGGKGVPKGPAAILIHLASTNVQFTSEAKEALADNMEVQTEIRKAALDLGRGLRRHLEKRKKMAKVREKFELINDILPAIAEKSASILDKPHPNLASSITKIMNAVILDEKTWWDKESKLTRVELKLQNFTARSRSYTVLAQWPEGKAEMVDNERGGRKETGGLWAWKLETLEPGVNATVNFSLKGLEKGDWKETEVFYRGAGDIIGANRLDEKILEELRRQENDGIETPKEEVDLANEGESEEGGAKSEEASEENGDENGWTSQGTGQQTLGV